MQRCPRSPARRRTIRSTSLIHLLDPFAAAVARQLARPSGWFGRMVMTRVLNRGNRDLVEATLDGLELPPGCALLDVGFGGGLLLELAYHRGARVLAGVDPSEEAVAWMQHRRRRLTGAELRLHAGVVEALPYQGAAFDVVTSTNTVYFWPDLPRAFAELHRVLRPGGVLSVGFSGTSKLRAFGNVTQHGFRFHEPAQLVEAATAAGLERVEVIDLHGRVTEGDHLLRASRPADQGELSAR
jgi:SAM-dependent methyltransferase